MRYRHLGSTGLAVSELALGNHEFSRTLSRGQAREAVADAWDAGINVFVGTGVTSADTLLGDVIADMRLPRDGYALVMPLGQADPAIPMQAGLTRKRLFARCDGLLKQLGTDVLDVLILPAPDGHTPLQETLLALQTLCQQGKLLHWGVQGWDEAALTQALTLTQAQRLRAPQVMLGDAPQHSEQLTHIAQAENVSQAKQLLADSGIACVAVAASDEPWLATLQRA